MQLLAHDSVHHFGCEAAYRVERIIAIQYSFLGPVPHVLVDKHIDRLVGDLAEHLPHNVVEDCSGAVQI